MFEAQAGAFAGNFAGVVYKLMHRSAGAHAGMPGPRYAAPGSSDDVTVLSRECHHCRALGCCGEAHEPHSPLFPRPGSADD